MTRIRLVSSAVLLVLVTSLAVPAVVGMATSGTLGFAILSAPS